MIPTRLLIVLLVFLGASSGARSAPPPLDTYDDDSMEHVASAPRLRWLAGSGDFQLTMHPPVVVMTADGRQPYLFATSAGTLFCQAQLNARPFHTKGKIVYKDRIGTAVSRDGGATWQRWTHQENHDDVFIEGGAVQRASGEILMLDSFVVPGAAADHGVGELWRSRNDLRTLEGPQSVEFSIPGIRWGSSTDDIGLPHRAARLHRSIVELPDGALLTTLYSWFEGDDAPCPYIPSMKKTRTVVLRSRDGGSHWSYLSTVAVDGAVGTEGFTEPVLARVPSGRHAGRLLCLMRTGRDLYGAHSDDQGATWSTAAPVSFPGIDIRDTAS